MLTNTDATLYRRIFDPKKRTDKWERVYIPAVWWFDSEESSLDSDGMHRMDKTTVRIPDVSVVIRKEDYLVKGNSEAEIATPQDLRGRDYRKVMSANYNRFGDNPHIKVGAE